MVLCLCYTFRYFFLYRNARPEEKRRKRSQRVTKINAVLQYINYDFSRDLICPTFTTFGPLTKVIITDCLIPATTRRAISYGKLNCERNDGSANLRSRVFGKSLPPSKVLAWCVIYEIVTRHFIRFGVFLRIDSRTYGGDLLSAHCAHSSN